MNSWANLQNPPREALQQEIPIDPRLRLNPNQEESPSRVTQWVHPNVVNALREMSTDPYRHQPSNQPATPQQKPQNVSTWANQQNQPTSSTPTNLFYQQNGPFDMQSDPRKRPPPSQPENPSTVKRDRIERPSSKLILLNIPDYLDRQKIETAFADFVSNPKVFVVTREDMGDKCSFAYVDLGSPALVRRWMETFEGHLVLPNKVVIAVEAARAVPDTLTWTCAACSTTQSMSNAFCERCSVIREESEDMIARGATLIGSTPTDTLLLRCLPKGVTGPRIAEGLSRVSQLVPIVHIHLGKSRRFAFVQMSALDHAELLMVSFQQAPLILDGQRVLVSYSRLSFPEWKAQQNRQTASVKSPQSKPTNIVNVQEGVANNLLASTQIVQDLSRPPPMLLPQAMQTFAAPTGFDASRPPPMIIQGAGNLSFGTPIILAPGTFPQPGLPLIIQQPGQLPQTITVALPTTSQPLLTGVPLQTSSLATIVQPATTMAAAQPLGPPGGVIGEIDTPFGTFPQYIAPNIPSFADDPTSGYKVDMVTMFYFDPKTNYHYSNTLKQWCIWEPMYATYIPVDKKKEMAENKEKADSTTSEEPKKSGQDIAREMMKWALKREKEKTKISLTLKKDETAPNRVANPTQDLGLRVLEKMQNPLRHLDRESSEDEESAMMEQKKRRSRWGSGAKTSTSRSTPPPANITEPELNRDGPTAQQQREEMERNLIDRPNKTCLLCRRAFASLDVLDKHVERSDLHKTNLEMKRVEWGKAYVAQMMAAMANE
ncbi:unnamed protein product, partial [Mesorhabditis belari]|uniref:RRM domain-containing protein n=1 Tax=Mesorhabditis belari TaxID=2138241 RepID=A0AAF3ET06_9BILA